MKQFAIAALALLLAAAVPGCKKAPTDVAYMDEVVRHVEVYYSTTNPIAAEATMLELESFTDRCEKAGSKGINVDQTYAAIYSRLYQVQVHLGKTNEAQSNYERAKERWQKSYARDGQPYTPEQLHRQITVGGGHLPEPKWKVKAP